LYFRRILIGIAVALDGKVTVVGNYVRVCHDAVAAYDEAGANSALKPSSVPRGFVIRVQRSCRNPHQTFLNRAVRFWRRNRYRDWNCLTCRWWARSPWIRPRWPLRLHRGTRRCAFLRVQNGPEQQGGATKNKDTLHGRKGCKLKQRTRKSRFGFALASGLFGHNRHDTCFLRSNL